MKNLEKRLWALAGKNSAEAMKELSRDQLTDAFLHLSAELINGPDSVPLPAVKSVIYTSMESLPGPTLSNCLMNLSDKAELIKLLDKYGLTIHLLEEADAEPKLGNGGLGRLVACLMESAITQGYPVWASTLRFRDGLFAQKVENGRQVEADDVWLTPDGKYPFEIVRKEYAQKICFTLFGRKLTAEAIPCDIPVLSASKLGSAKQEVGYTRTWMVGKIEAEKDGVPSHCEQICRQIDEHLYPDENQPLGKLLRLLQEYFLSAATVGWVCQMMADHEWPLESLPDHFVLHMNDTHPVLMIPELARVLCSKGMKLDEAMGICRKVFVYTNHTILAEALEKWSIPMVEETLPEVYRVIDQLHHQVETEIDQKYPGDQGRAKVLDILWDGQIRMANMAIHLSYSINGVARIHTDILRERELNDFYQLYPEKFHSITNGISHRKFVDHANPELSALLTDWTRSDDWKLDFNNVCPIRYLADQPCAQQLFAEAHKARKRCLAEYLRSNPEIRGRKVEIPENFEDFLFDIQVKRQHEYKRQLLSCLKIISLYQDLIEHPDKTIYPTAFLFAGKAASGYRKAKLILELILALEQLVNNDPRVNSMMRVIFIGDYNVAKAEMIMAATDCSEQISTASREASGTGCMKAIANGAVILGTMDGANVEIRESVGPENIFIFGLTKEAVMAYEKNPGCYNPQAELNHSEALRKAVNLLHEGVIRRCEPLPYGEQDPTFRELTREWLPDNGAPASDPYFVLKDFTSYMDAFMKMNQTFATPSVWNRLCLNNIAGASLFTSDRMVKEYAENIWHVDPILF